jgi:AraC family ethanolamine operon transcriptional activator
VIDVTTLSIPEISRVAGVSLRTLEYSFRDELGLTPLAFLRLQRLHAARRRLMNAGTGGTTVTEIACAHGFYQPARFAAHHHRLFNELPSQTLKSHYPEPPPHGLTFMMGWHHPRS